MRVVLDIETNGLDSDEHIILEVGAIAINGDLTLRRDPTFSTVIAAGAFYRDAADSLVRDMHDKNGLWRDCAASWTTRHQADEALAAWLHLHGVSRKDQVILCGHTISFDHGFIKKQFPITAQLIHYRMDDFGAVGRFAREVCGLPTQYTPKEKYTHRGLADCWLELEDARALRKLLTGTQVAVREALKTADIMEARLNHTLLENGDICEGDLDQDDLDKIKLYV